MPDNVESALYVAEATPPLIASVEATLMVPFRDSVWV